MTYPSCIQNPSAGILLALILMLAVSCSEEDCPTCPPSEDPVPTGWFVQETPTTESLGNLQVLNNLTVVAIGSAGTILRTGDGGDIWTPIPSGSGEDLRDVFFLDETHGWIVGNNGVALRSSDGGLTWVDLPVPDASNFREVVFVGATTGWIAGNQTEGQVVEEFLMKTEDGGTTWDIQTPPFSIRSMFFVDADTGFATGPVELMRTTDGGTTWTLHDCAPIGWIGNIYFGDTLNGWVSGGGGFMAATRDYGVSWEPQNSGTNRNIVEHFFLDASHGWYVARSPGAIAATTDGGLNWRFQTLPGEGLPSDVAFANEKTGWIAGQEGLILKTVTGGW